MTVLKFTCPAGTVTYSPPVGLLGEAEGLYPAKRDDLHKIINAMLVEIERLKQTRQPLTDAAIRLMRCDKHLDADDYPEAWAYACGVRDAEQHHQIGGAA